MCRCDTRRFRKDGKLLGGRNHGHDYKCGKPELGNTKNQWYIHRRRKPLEPDETVDLKNY